jgi:predicted nucleic acid-binding protein
MQLLADTRTLRQETALYVTEEKLDRTDRLALPVTLRHMANAEALIVTDKSSEQADAAKILRPAKISACYGYNCEFLALAKRIGAPLVSGDKGLIAALPETLLAIEALPATEQRSAKHPEK